MEFQIGNRVSYRNTLTCRFPKDSGGCVIYPVAEVIGYTGSLQCQVVAG